MASEGPYINQSLILSTDNNHTMWPEMGNEEKDHYKDERANN